jgi:hypothetical protein
LRSKKLPKNVGIFDAEGCVNPGEEVRKRSFFMPSSKKSGKKNVTVHSGFRDQGAGI